MKVASMRDKAQAYVMNVGGLEYSMMDGKTQCMSKHIANLASENFRI